MKKFYTILCIAIASLTQLQAQAPQGFQLPSHGKKQLRRFNRQYQCVF